MSERPWYRRFPDRFIAGTVRLTLEEKGAYSLVLDLMYVRGGPIADEPRYIAGVCNCSVRKWNTIRQRLIDLGKIEAVDGYLVNRRAEEELEISAKTAEERAESGRKGGEKAAENKAEHKGNKDLDRATLKHTRASLPLHPYRKKEGNSILKEEPASPESGAVWLDRFVTSEAELFAACEALTKPVPSFMNRQVWSRSIVDRAVANIMAAKSAGASKDAA